MPITKLHTNLIKLDQLEIETTTITPVTTLESSFFLSFFLHFGFLEFKTNFISFPLDLGELGKLELQGGLDLFFLEFVLLILTYKMPMFAFRTRIV